MPGSTAGIFAASALVVATVAWSGESGPTIIAGALPAAGAYSASIPDVSRRSVVVLEESPARGCQPWRWDRDHTECINATAQHARATGASGVGFTRGRTYRYSTRVEVLAGQTFTAVGDASRPRPVILAGRRATGIALMSGGEIRNLDIRGPHYNASPFRVRLHEDWEHKGINGANQSNWSVLGTSVNGFAGTGLLGVMSDNVTIVGNSFGHNGYSGVSLFSHAGNCGRGVEFRNNVLERNGQDGVDTCSSDAVFDGNTFRHNGWGGNGGDMHGLLVYVFTITGGARNIQITNNHAYGNHESGIRVAGTDVSGVVVEGNRVRGNRHWGLEMGDARGLIRQARVRGNQVSGNARGCMSAYTVRVADPKANSCLP
jgi:parallel beta-helix repeat protein